MNSDKSQGQDASAAAVTIWGHAFQYAPAAARAHSDDIAVDRFAAEMKTKLAAAREKGRGGWETCPPEALSQMLREHVEKGDPRDVANFAMFLWSLGQPISAAAPIQAQEDSNAS